MRIAIICLCSALIADPAWADGPAANPTRPTFSDNAHPMAEGHFELELGGQAWQGDQIGTPFLLKVGLSDYAEFKVGGDGLRWDGKGDAFGFGNLYLLNKLRFLAADGAAPAVAVLVAATLPTAHARVGGGTTNLSALLILSGSLGPVGWDFNLGVDVNGLDQDDISLGLPAILAVSIPIHGPLSAVVEVADYAGLWRQENALNFLGALTWSVTDGLVIDAAGVAGLGAAADWQVLFGFTLNAGRIFCPPSLP